MMKRREFLKLCLASSLAPNLGGFVNEDFGPLSFIHLSGGNDAYNTCVPLDNPDYFKLRPSLALNPEELLPLNDSYGLNPALSNLYASFKKGDVAVLLGIGYPDVSLGHVRAGQIWQENLKTQPITVEGFDTHFDQAQRHSQALLKLDEKIAELSKTRTCFIYSEMGRSLKENEDSGTDHGHVNLAFLIGKGVSGGIFGAYPEPEREGDFSIDCRKVGEIIRTGTFSKDLV